MQFSLLGLFLVFVSIQSLWGNEIPARDAASDATNEALLSAVETNSQYCRQWLADHDFKSLNRGIVGVKILAEVVASKREDDSWKAVGAKMTAAVGSLEESGKKRNAADVETALKNVDLATAEFKALPPGKIAAAAAVKPRGGFRNLMYLMEGTFADAKTSLAVGDGKSAKKSALVLSELGRIVSNEKTNPQWKQWSDDFLAATRAAAEAKDDGPRRPLFHAISQRCDACHEKK